MEENIIINLQSVSNEFLDVLFKVVSHMVSWAGAIIIFLIIFLFVNRKFGLIYGLGLLGTIGFNYLLKVIINRPRPFEVNENIINKLSTIGQSFPSGHLVSATFIVLSILMLFYILNKQDKFLIYNKLWFKLILIFSGFLIIFITAISRMYLGQHYLSDIIGGIFVSLFGFCITTIVFKKLDKKRTKC